MSITTKTKTTPSTYQPGVTAAVIAQTLMLPGTKPPQRVPSFPNVERTATMSFRVTDTDSVTTNKYMLMAAPGCPVWKTGSVTSTLMEYGELPARPNPGTLDTGRVLLSSGAWTINSATLGLGALPTGLVAKSLPLGVLKGDVYVYAPPGTSRFVRVTFGSATSVTGTLECQIRYWRQSDDSFLETFTMTTSGTSAYMGWSAIGDYPFFRVESVVVKTTATAPAATSILVSAGWATSASYTAPTGTVTAFFPALGSLPQSSVSTVPWASVRLTALSLLATNVTKVLNKEGTVNCARLSISALGSNFIWNPLESVITSVHPSLRYFGPLERGVYTWLPPTTETTVFQSAQFMNAIFNDYTAPPAIDLENIEMVNAIVLTDPDTATTSSMALTIDMHTEFRSTSTLWPVAVCGTGLEVYHRAATAVASMCPFTENIIHVPSIIAAISKHLLPATYAVTKLAEAVYDGYQTYSIAKGWKPKQPQLTQPRKTKKQKRSKKEKEKQSVTLSLLPAAGFVRTKRGTRVRSRSRSATR